MNSIFSKIIRREIPSYAVAEDDKHYAFLDIRPLRKGHTLAVPKREVDHLIDLSEAEHSALWAFAQKIALSIRELHALHPGGVCCIGNGSSARPHPPDPH